jgi:hypothetical protein
LTYVQSNQSFIELASHGTYIAIGVYCSLLMVMSLCFNLALIIIFIKNKKNLTALKLLKITMASLNLVSTIVELPFVISNAFSFQ